MIIEIPDDERKVFLQDKIDRIQQEMDSMVAAIKKILITIPRVRSKHQRNVLIKTYQRRPRIEKKRTEAMKEMIVIFQMNWIRIAMINAQPVPKFRYAGVSGSAIVRGEQPEMIEVPGRSDDEKYNIMKPSRTIIDRAIIENAENHLTQILSSFKKTFYQDGKQIL